jgi:hypothetical protein
MVTNAKLLVSVVGLVAIAATPAMAKTHHVHHACRSHAPSDRPLEGMPTNPVFRAQQPEPVGEANTATPTIGSLQIVTEVPDNWIMKRGS